MTAAGGTTYAWDAANRLKSVNGGSLGSYGYDGNGKRVKKTESGTTTYYVLSSVLGSAMEVTSAGVQRAYVMGGGSVVAQLNANGQFYWLHLDHLGSGRKMTDASGNMTYRAEFDPYGKLLYEWSSPTNLNTKKFTGYERDAATNLDYAQARMYGSEWARFMSPDPMGLGSASLTSPKTLNRYAYVNGDPVNLIDPDGLSGIPIITPSILPFGFTLTIVTVELGPQQLLQTGTYGITGWSAVQEALRKAAEVTKYWQQFMQQGQAPVSLPTQPPRNWNELLLQSDALKGGIDQVNKLLENPDCANIIGLNSDEAKNLFSSLTFNFADFNQYSNSNYHNTATSSSRGMSFAWVGASTNEVGGRIVTINTSGPFVDGKIKFTNGTAYAYNEVSGRIIGGLSLSNIRAMILLHELGHASGKFGDDSKDSSLNLSYTMQVLSGCLSGGRR